MEQIFKDDELTKKNMHTMKLENWYSQFNSNERLTLNQTQELIKLMNCTNDKEVKKQYRDRIFCGTIYVLYTVLKSGDFCLLNSSKYDMDDIISASSEIWLNFINDGLFLDVKHYSEMFTNGFYGHLTDALISRQSIYDDVSVGIHSFKDLFREYLELKYEKADCTINDFAERLQDLYLLGNNPYSITYLYNLLENLYDSMNLANDVECDISMTKFDKLKYFFINNGIEYGAQALDNLIDETNLEDEVANEIYNQQILKYIFDSPILNERQKVVLTKRYGLDGTGEHTFAQIADILKMSTAGARNLEISTMRLLRTNRKIQKMIQKTN